jgi:hypothetical protein
MQKRNYEVPYFVSFHSLDWEDVPAGKVIVTALQDLATILCEFLYFVAGWWIVMHVTSCRLLHCISVVWAPPKSIKHFPQNLSYDLIPDS